MNFDSAFARVIGDEGGYTDGAGDPGGETKFGVSKRQYPALDIKNLSLAQAKAIYLSDYWRFMQCDALPEDLRYEMFDFGVNSGPATAIKFLQGLVGTKADGVIGPVTLAAVAKLDVILLQVHLLGARLEFMTTLPNWPTASRGWTRRIALQLKGIGNGS